MPEPSLGELLSIQEAPAKPFVPDNREMIRGLHEAAQFKAENDWKKYNLALSNYKDATKDLQEISKMEIADQDKPELQRQMAEIFQDMGNNPMDFLKGKKVGEVQARLAQLQGLATQSKQNNTFDKFNREYLVRNPELSTDDNKRLVQGYLDQPLGQRKEYLLNQAAVFDYGSFAKGIWDNPSVTQPFADVKAVGSDGKSPGDEFIREVQGKKSDRNNFLSAWNAGLNFQKDKYGHPIRTAIESQFKQLPSTTQDYFEKMGKQKGVDGVTAFWNHQGEAEFNNDKDILRTESEKLLPNQYTLERTKAADRLAEQKQKENFDISLELQKEKAAKGLARLRQDLKNKGQGVQQEWLKNYTNGLRDDAMANGTRIYKSGENGRVLDGFEMPLSEPALNVFAFKEGAGTDKKVVQPDRIIVSPDGKRVTAKFYKKDKDGNIDKDDKGNEPVDDGKTKSFSIDEFEARIGKDMIGISGLNKSLKDLLGSSDDDSDDDEDSGGGTSAQPVSSGKKTIKGF